MEKLRAGIRERLEKRATDLITAQAQIDVLNAKDLVSTPDRAVGYINDKIAVRDMQQTTGPAIALKLSLANGPVCFNGEDIALLTCIAVDADGREVPDATPLVHFDGTGDGHIVGTGSDNTDHVPVPCLSRKMYAGKISIAVKLGSKPDGSFTLFARTDNLLPAYQMIQ